MPTHEFLDGRAKLDELAVEEMAGLRQQHQLGWLRPALGPVPHRPPVDQLVGPEALEEVGPGQGEHRAQPAWRGGAADEEEPPHAAFFGERLLFEHVTLDIGALLADFDVDRARAPLRAR